MTQEGPEPEKRADLTPDPENCSCVCHEESNVGTCEDCNSRHYGRSEADLTPEMREAIEEHRDRQRLIALDRREAEGVISAEASVATHTLEVQIDSFHPALRATVRALVRRAQAEEAGRVWKLATEEADRSMCGRGNLRLGVLYDLRAAQARDDKERGR